MYTGGIGTAGQIEPAFAHSVLKYRSGALLQGSRSAPFFDQALRGRRVYIAQTPRWASSPKGCYRPKPRTGIGLGGNALV
jgi:hypothetical protein